MPTPRPSILVVLALVVLVAILMIPNILRSQTRTTSHPSTTNAPTAQNATTNPSETDYSYTGGLRSEDNEKFVGGSATNDGKPPNIEEIIRRTDEDLLKSGLPALTTEEVCMAKAVTNGSDRSVCTGIQ